MVGRTTNFPTDGRWSLRKVRDEMANDSWVGPPAAASSVSGSATGDTTATVTYTASSGATSYKVYYSTSSGVDTSDSVVSGNSTTANITGLSANTQYYFRVEMINDLGGTLDASDSTFTTYPAGTTSLSAGTTTNITSTSYAIYALPVGKTVEIHCAGGGGGGGGTWNLSGKTGGSGGVAAASFTSNGELIKAVSYTHLTLPTIYSV